MRKPRDRSARDLGFACRLGLRVVERARVPDCHEHLLELIPAAVLDDAPDERGLRRAAVLEDVNER